MINTLPKNIKVWLFVIGYPHEVTSGLTLGAEKMTERVQTSSNLKSSFEEKAKLPNLLDKKEFNYRALYPIGPKLDHNVNQ